MEMELVGVFLFFIGALGFIGLIEPEARHAPFTRGELLWWWWAVLSMVGGVGVILYAIISG